jgi:hypothetical protein
VLGVWEPEPPAPAAASSFVKPLTIDGASPDAHAAMQMLAVAPQISAMMVRRGVVKAGSRQGRDPA